MDEVCQTYRNNYISALLRHRNPEDGPENHGAYIHRREEQGRIRLCAHKRLPTSSRRRKFKDSGRWEYKDAVMYDKPRSHDLMKSARTWYGPHTNFVHTVRGGLLKPSGQPAQSTSGRPD